LANSLRGRNVRFVGIDEQDVATRARAFAAAAHVDYSQLVDPDGTVLAKLTMLPSDAIPSTLVIDTDGQVAARIIGAADESGLRHLVERVAASG
jgi:peroxiredoxin